MTDGRTKFQINISEEDEGSRNSLESGKVLFKKKLPDKEVASSGSPSKTVEQSEVDIVSQGSQSKQNSQSSQAKETTGSALGGKSFAQTFAYLKNTDLYKLPAKPVHDTHTLPKNTNAIIVNGRQRGNPILKHVKNVPWEFGDIIPDYQVGERHCVLFLSLRYHNLNPDYIHERLKLLGNRYDLRVILVQVDVKNCKHNLKELGKMCLMAGCTLILAWSPEEAGRYLETYKQYENKPPNILQERVETDYFAKIQDVLTTVKSINKTDAITLLSTFGSLQNIINASKDEIEVCPGFGQLKAQRLHKVFNEPFKRLHVHDEQSQQSKSPIGSIVAEAQPEQSLATLQLKKPSEHSYLQKCLSQNCESPPHKVKCVAVDDASPSKPVPLPVSDSSKSSHSPEKARKTIQASSAEVSKIPSNSDDLNNSENLSIKEIYEKVKPRMENRSSESAEVKQPGMSSPNDVSKKSISQESAGNDAETSKDYVRAQKSKSIPSHKMSKSEAVFKSGLSISRNRKDGEVSRVLFNNPGPEKVSNMKITNVCDDNQKPSQSESDIPMLIDKSPNKPLNVVSTNADKCSTSTSALIKTYTASETKKKQVIVDSRLRNAGKVSNMKITNVCDGNQKPSQSKSDIPMLIDKSPKKLLNVVSTNTDKCSTSTSALIKTYTASETKKKQVIVDSRLRNTEPSGKVRVGTLARKASESEQTKDVFNESYSTQMTNDEFLDLLADDDDDDDEDDII